MDKRNIQLLEDIKKLIILGLMKNDVKGKEIAGILGVDPAIVSRLISNVKKVKK